MSKLKATPGPWWPTDHGVRDKGGYIAQTIIVTRYPGQDQRYAFEVAEREANKLLIAAAPDLYAVLSELEEACEYWSEYDVPIGIVERIKSVLKQARGEPC